MKSYVINLPRATERRDSIRKEFEKYELEFEFYSAVDWMDLTDQDISDNVDPNFIAERKSFGRPSLTGTLACWLSHRNLWKTALNNGESVVAIFEDDATLTPETKQALKLLKNSDELKFDIVFLYNGKLRNPLIPIYKLNDNFSLNLIKYDSIGAVGYVIRDSAMNRLLDKFPKMVIHIDALMHYYWWTGLKTYILTPQVVFHGIADQKHHSYSSESLMSEHMVTSEPKSKPISKLGGEFRKFWFYLFPKYIPQVLNFRRRLQTESKANSQN